jgi:hypothetical protein
MGGGNWTDDAAADRAKVRATTGGPTFAHSAAIHSGRATRAAHATMNPKVVAGKTSPFVGNIMRESRDSADHPDSLAIGVMFDETGSMAETPVELQKRLATLMKLLVSKGYVLHPQILFGAIGDANSDDVPLQVGQFESDLTMDDNLTNIFLEGNGGGHGKETYELAHYFFARHTSIDCFEKRGHKGYFFTMGDEGFYDHIRRDQVKELIGDTLEADLKTVDIVRELEEKYHVFHIIVEHGAFHAKDSFQQKQWRELLGERCITLSDPANVAELIALTIGLCEGTTDIDAGAADLASVGVDAKTVSSVKTALVPFAASATLAKAGVVSGLPHVASSGGVDRL